MEQNTTEESNENSMNQKFIIHTSTDKYPNSANNVAKITLDLNKPFKDVMNEIYKWFITNAPSAEIDQPDHLIKHAITFETIGAFYFQDGSELVLPEIILKQPDNTFTERLRKKIAQKRYEVSQKKDKE